MAPRQLCADFLGILLLVTHSVSEKFSLSGSPYPVVGIVGQDVVLPCQLSPRTWPVDTEVLWSKIEGTHSEAGYVNVHQYKNQSNLDILGDNYQRRTEMFQQEFRNGNVSLKLKRLHVTDAGTYICFVKSPTWSHEANTELQIAAVAPVFIDVLGPHGQGIGLACRSTGWFPKPELHWAGNKGQNLELESKTGMTQDNESLYNVLGHVTVPRGEAPAEIICVVQNGLLKTDRESAIHLSDDIFPHTSPWLSAFWVSFMLLLLTNGAWAFRGYKEKQKISQKKRCEKEALLSLEAQKKELESEQHDRSKRIERLTVELDFRKARSYMVPITLDPDCKHPALKVSGDGRRVWHEPESLEQTTPSGALIAVGREGFVRGRQYWEVEVGDEPDWELGVLSETVRDRVIAAQLENPPVEGCWSLRRAEGLYHPREANTKIREWDLWPTVIGVYLDRDAGTVSFYNVNVLADIFVVPLDNSEKVYPFLRPGHAVGRDKGKPLSICSLRDWDFPTKLSVQTVCQDRDNDPYSLSS
ncbi:butyrophilin subfamily 3 member A1-like [Mauremys mutica]|nr:butyrophilin subfamily 3 member A1-like [Mauremys mutica]